MITAHASSSIFGGRELPKAGGESASVRWESKEARTPGDPGGVDCKLVANVFVGIETDFS